MADDRKLSARPHVCTYRTADNSSTALNSSARPHVWTYWKADKSGEVDGE